MGLTTGSLCVVAFVCAVMASPVKLPPVKKLRADDGANDMEEDEGEDNEFGSEGMPTWAEGMMKSLMKHTTNEINGLKIEVDEAKSMAKDAQVKR